MEKENEIASDKGIGVTNVVTETFHCSLERAFKTPILGDVTKILIGPGGLPIVRALKNDKTWGVAGGSRVLIMPGGLFMKNKERGFDQIFIRDENKYWKWGVNQMVGTSNFFFLKAQGELWFTDNQDGTISVKWKYIWFSRNIFTYAYSWLFVKLIWNMVMKNGIKNMKRMAENETPYIYNK